VTAGRLQEKLFILVVISDEQTSVALQGWVILYALASLRASPLANFCRAFGAG